MESKERTIKIIKQLLRTQKLAVLATNKDGQPYTSLIAFVAANDINNILFATAKTTRKYSNLTADARVSVLIDSRTNKETDFHKAFATTAIGKAKELNGKEKEELIPIYLSKHPHLENFVKPPTCAFININVESYYTVSKFQKVVELKVK